MRCWMRSFRWQTTRSCSSATSWTRARNPRKCSSEFWGSATSARSCWSAAITKRWCLPRERARPRSATGSGAAAWRRLTPTASAAALPTFFRNIGRCSTPAGRITRPTTSSSRTPTIWPTSPWMSSRSIHCGGRCSTRTKSGPTFPARQ